MFVDQFADWSAFLLRPVEETFWKTQILARGQRGKTGGRFGGVPGGAGVG